MRFIKLGATSSTNDYLKDLHKTSAVEPFTIVSADYQTKGRGQRGTTWVSESAKNLMFSMLIRSESAQREYLFYLNAAVALAISQAFIRINVPQISIKWPNDIMSGSKKIGGILIENVIGSDGTITSVIGVGLNVNQQNFTALPSATSLARITGRDFDRDQLLKSLAEDVKTFIGRVSDDAETVWNEYNDMIFKKGEPSKFISSDSEFTGVITGVQKNGQLEVDVDHLGLKCFDIKQIQMLY